VGPSPGEPHEHAASGDATPGGTGAHGLPREPAPPGAANQRRPAADGGAALWDFFATFVDARHAFRRLRRRYERRVLDAAAERNVARENLVLPPAQLWRLFDLARLEDLRDRRLEPLRRQSEAIFGERGDEGLMDAFCGHVYHELAILCEEHRSVGRFVRIHDPGRYRELFQEVSGYYPTRLKRIRRFFAKGLERLEELLPAWARHRVVVRSAYLFGERLGQSAWREGRDGLYARMYPQGRAPKGLLEAARSFHAAGFDDQARGAAAEALAARAQAAAPALLQETEAFLQALGGPAALPPNAPVGPSGP
jgi:hypothetical protein